MGVIGDDAGETGTNGRLVEGVAVGGAVLAAQPDECVEVVGR